MSTAREAFLQRVRQAVRDGNRAGVAAAVEPRGRIGYQGAGNDPVARFREQCTAAGGHVHVVADDAGVIDKVLTIVQSVSARRVLLGRGPVLDPLDLASTLRKAGLDVTSMDTLLPATSRDPLFAADVGVSGVDALIAETGTVALLARPGEPRSLSLLPPVHIAVATRRQVIPDLFDLFEPPRPGEQFTLPSCLSLITGPSKTGDIELRLVTGVHGPGEIHVVLRDA